MRHKISGRKLQRTSGHRTAMLRNMAAALIKHEQIKTTVAKGQGTAPLCRKADHAGEERWPFEPSSGACAACWTKRS